MGASGPLTNEYEPHATFWERDGTSRALEEPTGFELTRAVAVNRQGEAVGSGLKKGPGVKPILWDRSGTGIELPILEGYEDSEALAINDRGEIAGTSYTDGRGDKVTVIWR